MKTAIECIAINIRELRKAKGWTIEVLAEKCGKSWQAIQLLESKKSWPEQGTIKVIASALGVPESRLFLDRTALRPSLNESFKVIADELGFEAKPKKNIRLLDGHKKDRPPLPDLSHIPKDIVETFARLHSEDWDMIRALIEGLVEGGEETLAQATPKKKKVGKGEDL